MPAAETMNEPLNTLAIVEDTMEWTELKFRWFRPRQEVTRRMPIYEFYVDGASLLSLIDPEEADDPDRRLPMLGERPKESLDQLQQLLGGPVPADRNGRVWLLYCQCGDPGCGGLGTRVVFTDTTVVWTDFRWESIFFDIPAEQVEFDRTFVFDRTGYEKLMHDLIRRLSGGPTRLA